MNPLPLRDVELIMLQMAIEAYISLMTTVIVSCLHKIHSIATMAPTAVMVAFG